MGGVFLDGCVVWCVDWQVSLTCLFMYCAALSLIVPAGVFVANHTSMIDFIVLQQRDCYAVVRSQRTCDFGRCSELGMASRPQLHN